jgi:hypothetical protein
MLKTPILVFLHIVLMSLFLLASCSLPLKATAADLYVAAMAMTVMLDTKGTSKLWQARHKSGLY